MRVVQPVLALRWAGAGMRLYLDGRDWWIVRTPQRCQVAIKDEPPCGVPGRAYRMGCIHEHVADGMMCDKHAAMLTNWRCMHCEAVDGHECLLAMVELAGQAIP